MFNVKSAAKVSRAIKLGPFIHNKRLVSSYVLPSIQLLDELNVNKQDFKGLFPHATYNELWFKRGEKILEELNESLVESQLNGPNNFKELINLTINKPELIKIYNASSVLYNMQFFFETLKEGNENYEFLMLNELEIFRNPNVDETITNSPQDEVLVNWLNASFGSVQEFKNLLLNSARSIKGDGITWLVAEPTVGELILKNSFNGSLNETNEPRYSKLSVMNTYNAGTVDDSVRSGQFLKLQQQKKAKIALENEQLEKSAQPLIEDSVDFQVKDENYLFNMEEAEFLNLYSDKKLVPVLAIDASMRNYLLDYGVFGKQQYLENVWNCINWDIVKQRLPPRLIVNFSI